MNTTAYNLSIDQTATFIAAVGAKRSVVAQGYSGTGKTSGIKAKLKTLLPDHIYVEFDCTNKDIQDVSAPKFMKKVENMISDYVEFVPNAELGAHLGVPVIINFDELFKAPDPVKKAVRRIMLERMVGTIKLPEGSIIYGTSNLTSEGLGDTLPMHQRNAIIVVKTRKPTVMELLEYGINNDWDSIMLGWIKDNGETLLQTFDEVKDPSDNPYIHHPRNPIQGAVFTPRSGEMGSDVLKVRHMFDDQTLTAALMGAIGERGGLDLMAYVKLSTQLPSSDSIKKDPMGAVVPTSISAICMVVFRTLSTIERDWVDPWMDYLSRLDTEAQAMFANGVRAEGYAKQSVVMTNKKFTQWALANNYMFAADSE
jgi:hypothetical protein